MANFRSLTKFTTMSFLLWGYLAPVRAETVPTPASTPPPLDLYIRGANPDYRRISDAALGQEYVFSNQDLRDFTPLSVDTFLKQIPGFSLFRRSSSLTTNPTGQGVSLRGTGPSGAGRTVVLLDGIPISDPFGGWVNWGRIPVEGLDRIRVQEGWASNHWSYLGFAGTVEMQTREPASSVSTTTVSGGNHGSRTAHGYVSERFENVAVSLGGEAFETNGFKTIANEDRGIIDIDSDSHHALGYGKVTFSTSDTSDFYLLWNGFSEGRSAGTPSTRNGTNLYTIAAGGRTRGIVDGEIRFDIFATSSDFESTFSSQSPSRNEETPASNQFEVPSEIIGVQSDWSNTFDSKYFVEIGTDAIYRQGESNEDFRYVDGAFQRRREAGADQFAAGLYAFGRTTLTSDFSVDTLARVNTWHTWDIFRRERDLSTSEFDRNDSDDSSWDTYPELRLQGSWQATARSRLRSAITSGRRIPTINEISRPFRVRNDVTEANASLQEEQNLGYDLEYSYSATAFDTSLTFYANRLRDYVGNVTVATGASETSPCGFLPDGGSCRIRENLGEARIFGVQTRTMVPLSEALSTEVSYLATWSQVTDAPEAPELEGKDLIQLPRHQAISRLQYNHPAVRTFVQLRYVGTQYEDDLNTLRLHPFVSVDSSATVPVSKGLELFVTFENLLGNTYQVSESNDGTTGIGTPFTGTVGVRASF